jgi:hypothetical protein
MSAYFQNGAGELVGMCWLGRWAVLGGASLGCTRRGAGVAKDPPSSWRYDEVRVGEAGGFSPGPVEDALVFRSRGRGLPSAPMVASSGSGFREFRTGVMWALRRVDRGCGDPDGETFRFRADTGSTLPVMSLGLWET